MDFPSPTQLDIVCVCVYDDCEEDLVSIVRLAGGYMYKFVHIQFFTLYKDILHANIHIKIA